MHIIQYIQHSTNKTNSPVAMLVWVSLLGLFTVGDAWRDSLLLTFWPNVSSSMCSIDSGLAEFALCKININNLNRELSSNYLLSQERTTTTNYQQDTFSRDRMCFSTTLLQKYFST